VRTIYLVMKSGPEWDKPVESWTEKRAASLAAAELERQRIKRVADHTGKGLTPAMIEDSLSHYVVKPVDLKGDYV